MLLILQHQDIRDFRTQSRNCVYTVPSLSYVKQIFPSL